MLEFQCLPLWSKVMVLGMLSHYYGSNAAFLDTVHILLR